MTRKSGKPGVSTLLGLISVISSTGDRTSDHRMQSQNSATEYLVHITRKRCQIEFDL